MKKRLMERNVAEGIAESVCASVGRSLVGQKLASFTGVGTLVRRAFEEALSGILHKRQVDVLLDIRKSQVIIMHHGYNRHSFDYLGGI